MTLDAIGNLVKDNNQSKLFSDTPYGTGPGYSKNIIACETCMKDDSQHPQAALFKIHP